MVDFNCRPKEGLLVSLLSWVLLSMLAFPNLSGYTWADMGSTNATTKSKSPHVHHIAGLLEVSNFTSAKQVFMEAIGSVNKDPSTKVMLEGIPMIPWSNPQDNLMYVCDAIYNHNITTFLVLGPQKMINILSIVTNYVGIPVVGFNTDTHKIGVKAERPLYLQLDPSKALLARAIVKTLLANRWHFASLIIEDTYANDGFLETFLRLTPKSQRWHVEDKIVLSAQHTDQNIDYKLQYLLENRSRLLILHCSISLARRVFQVAKQNGLTLEGYAWFVTENVVTKNKEILREDYPIGLVAFTLNYSYYEDDLVSDAVKLISLATEKFSARYGSSLDGHVTSKGCITTPTVHQQNVAQLYYSYLKSTTFIGKTGKVSFDDEGIRSEANFKVLNLIADNREGKRWRTIGSFKNSTLRFSTIIWPGDTVTGPITYGKKTVRVVTNIIAPFVMEAEAVNNQCTTAMKCLVVHTKDKETIDDIFNNFEHNILNDSRYQVRCCQGLSIMLLERLSRDLNFKVQLYITADRRYGNDNGNGSWNGIVGDLLNGCAHMSMAALSITRSRSRVIDFTEPYFYSGFSILVSERKRNTPIYAFMEPFDGWVWIAIVIGATMVACAVSAMEWRSPFGLNPWGRKRKTKYTFGSALNMVYAIFFQHTIKTKSPKAWPSKWTQNFWAGASIFIYSSYTANLAAFLAGKNSGVTITGIHDPRLVAPDQTVGLIGGNAVEDFLYRVNHQVLSRSHRYHSTQQMNDSVLDLMVDKIDAYLDDTPILEYARTTMDSKCSLRLVGEGFGEDGYGIGLPKGSPLKKYLTRNVLKYHESGFIEDLKDLYFRRSKCNDNDNDGQLQGEASEMVFEQHAGLYLLLLVGIFVCILLMFLEHATFKWLVPYWRKKPTCSFWKSYSMMFWSQRLYRIITSEELVSPHHSAREMMEVVRNRDFTKLFQKSVKKQERQARNRKNLFSVVEQLQWKQRREERLSQNPSLQTDCSLDSDNSATPVNLNVGRQIVADDVIATTDTNDDPGDEWPDSWEKDWPGNEADDDDEDDDAGEEDAMNPQGVLYKDGHINHSFTSQADIARNIGSGSGGLQNGAGATAADANGASAKLDSANPNCSGAGTTNYGDKTDSGGGGKRNSLDGDCDSHRQRPPMKPPRFRQRAFDFDICVDDNLLGTADAEDESQSERGFANPGAPLLGNNSSSEDNILMGSQLPNGVLILSPNGDVFARDASGKSILVRPKALSNFKNFTTNLPQSMKTLPLKDNRVKSNLFSRSRTLDRMTDDTITNDIEPGGVNLDQLTKEQVYHLWRVSESELNQQLRQALEDKAELEQKLAMAKTPQDLRDPSQV